MHDHGEDNGHDHDHEHGTEEEEHDLTYVWIMSVTMASKIFEIEFFEGL